MQRVVFTVAVLLASLGFPVTSAAQGLPSGGYYADGAYYVPADPSSPAMASGAADTASACPPGYGYPTVYVAHTATAVLPKWVWPVGGEAPGFPYVPVYSSRPLC